MKKILFLFSIIAMMVSCDVYNPVITHDVYIGGNPGRIGYWKNGSPVSITNPSGFGFGLDIFVDNDNVYVAGTQTLVSSDPVCSFAFTGRYWRNGVVKNLTDSCNWSAANGIVVVNNDVYAAGYSTKFTDGPNTATYWKNGVPTYLSDETDRYAEANDIAVVGTTVYAVGHDHGIATLWTNGVATNLWTGIAEKIKVVNGNVYVVGNELKNGKELATVWVNGVKYSLSTGAVSERASGISISGSDVFVSGSKLVSVSSSGSVYTAQYWKNGAVVSLPTTGNSYATDIAVVDNIVYVVGTNDNYYAAMWKDGVVVTLPHGDSPSYATSIFVDRKVVLPSNE